MKYKLLTLAALLVSSIITTAQTFDTLYTKSLGGSGTECNGTSQLSNLGMAAASVAIDSNGDMYITCSTASNDGFVSSNQGQDDIWVLKLNSLGDTLWTKVLGGTESERSYKIKVNPASGGCYVVGQTGSNNGSFPISNGSSDGFIAKLNSNGSLLWARQYGGSNLDVLYDLDFSSDGSIVAVGEAVSDDGDLSGTGNGLAWVVWVDPTSGDIQDSRTYLGPNASNPDFLENFSTITHLSDNSGFLLGGYTTPDGLDFNLDNIFLAKISETGTLNFTKSIGSTARDGVAKILEAENNTFFVLGMIQAGGGDVSTYLGGPADAWLVKCDALGNKIFDVSYGGTNWEFFTDAVYDAQGNILASAFSRSTNGNLSGQTPSGLTDFWLLKLNQTGEVLAQKLIGGTSNDFCLGIDKDAQGDIVCVGRTESNDGAVYGNNGGRDLWVVKFGGVTVNLENQLENSKIAIFPNPATNYLKIEAQEQSNSQYKIFNHLGQLVEQWQSNQITQNIELSNLSNGFYLLQATNNKGTVEQKKFVIQR